MARKLHLRASYFFDDFLLELGFLAVAFDLLEELDAFAFDEDDLDDFACTALDELFFFDDDLWLERGFRTGLFQSTARSARNLAGITIGPSA